MVGIFGGELELRVPVVSLTPAGILGGDPPPAATALAFAGIFGGDPLVAAFGIFGGDTAAAAAAAAVFGGEA